MKVFYVFAMFLGTILPWYFFGSYFFENGLNIVGFVSGVFSTQPATGFTIDVLLSIAVFLVWSYKDSQAHNIRNWWLVIPACCSVGLSLALPLYLYIRETNKA